MFEKLQRSAEELQVEELQVSKLELQVKQMVHLIRQAYQLFWVENDPRLLDRSVSWVAFVASPEKCFSQRIGLTSADLISKFKTESPTIWMVGCLDAAIIGDSLLRMLRRFVLVLSNVLPEQIDYKIAK